MLTDKLILMDMYTAKLKKSEQLYLVSSRIFILHYLTTFSTYVYLKNGEVLNLS